jgi:hypothetical protein
LGNSDLCQIESTIATRTIPLIECLHIIYTSLTQSLLNVTAGHIDHTIGLTISGIEIS